MPGLKLIKPPRININPKNKGFWKQIGMIIIGTTISLIFTVVATRLLEHSQRAKDRRLSAMMVISNIEKFARNMEEHERYLCSLDSTASWLLNTPVEDLELLPEDELNSLIQQSTSFIFISYDKSTESIFSNNIETWKNIRAWFTNVAATMRYQNRRNMVAIGITEQEVMDFTDTREQGDKITDDSPDISQFITPPLSRDSLTTKLDLDARLEELKN